MRITKKIASEIFKKVVGTDKGMEKFQRGIEDIWVIKLGVITTILRDELKYDLFGNRVEGKYWIVYIDTKYGEDIRVYIEKQTLKIDDFYTQEKFQERKIESMWTSRMYLEDRKFILIRLVLQIESVRRF